MAKFNVTVTSPNGMGSIEFEEVEAEVSDTACEMVMDLVYATAEECEEDNDN